MLDYIANHDRRVMRVVNAWRAPRWFRLWMLYATRGGDGWLWFIISVFLLIFDSARWIVLGTAGSALAASCLLFLVIKKKTKRRRPCDIAEHCWATLLPPDQFSFPSGHSMNAFAVAVVLGCFYPSLTGALLFCALSIALSRVILGMHFISDVVAGSCMGALIGYLAYALYTA